MNRYELIENLISKAEENKRQEEQELLRYSNFMIGATFVRRIRNMTIYYKITSLHPYYSNFVLCSLLSYEKDDDGNIIRCSYVSETEFDLNDLDFVFEIVNEEELNEVVDTLHKAMLSTMC